MNKLYVGLGIVAAAAAIWYYWKQGNSAPASGSSASGKSASTAYFTIPVGITQSNTAASAGAEGTTVSPNLSGASVQNSPSSGGSQSL